jgi:hypothetical protein
MRKLMAIIALGILFASCNRAVTPGEAANNKYKHCRPVR